MIYSQFMIYIFQGRWIPDLYDLAHVAGWESCDLHGTAHVSWVRSVLRVQILHNNS